jgi:hypothetical protein
MKYESTIDPWNPIEDATRAGRAAVRWLASRPALLPMYNMCVD